MISLPIKTLENQKIIEKWFQLEKVAHAMITGDVKLQLTVDRTGSITVRVVEARNLMASDPNGFSDPYVRVIFGKQKKKTKTVKKNLNPFFNEEFVL